MTDIKELAGFGVVCAVDGVPVLVGNAKLMESSGVKDFEECKATGTAVYVAQNGVFAGYIVVADTLKADSANAVHKLKNAGMKTVMLTGDVSEIGKKIAAEVGVDTVYTDLLPQQKVEKLEEILAAAKGKVCYVGDGINDAPVLARADIGIAMGALGSDAAIEAADVVIMNDEIGKIATAIRVAQKTLGIVKQNIVFAIGVKVLVLILVAMGLASMWWAVFADVGVAVIAILNAIRALNTKGM